MTCARRLAWARGGPILVLVLLLTGCIKAQLHRPQNIEPKEGYTLAFIEFDDQGEPWAPSQLERTIQLIERGNREGKRSAVILFVHGWHNDASKREDRKRDNNVEGFQRLLKEVRRTLQQEGYSQDELPLIGVYLSWRGRSTDVGVLKPFTFYSRRGAGQRVAGVSTTEAILRVMSAAKQNPHSAGIVIGHSFGGMIVERALMQALVGYTVDREEQIDAMADMVILVNPASQSMHAKNMLSMMKRNRLKFYREDREGERREAPFIVSITSTGDSATGSLYPTALGVKGWTKNFRQYEPTDCSPVPSQKKFYKQTAGHNRILHSHVVVTGEPLDPESKGDPDMTLEESIDPETGEKSYSFPGQDYMFTIKRLPFGYNNTPYWIMSVPPELIAGHSDIFTYNTVQTVRALLRMSGAFSQVRGAGPEGGSSYLVREDGVQPLEVIVLPRGRLAFLDLSRRFYVVGPDSRRPIGLSCLPPVIQPDSAIGIMYSGSQAFVVASDEETKGEKIKVYNDVIAFDFGLNGSESIEWTEIRADVSFTAADGNAETGEVYLTRAGGLYVVDLKEKKPRARPLSTFADEIEIESMKLDVETNRLIGLDRDAERLYIFDMNEEAPVPVLVAEQLGLIADLDVSPGSPVLLADMTGRQILEIDCTEGTSCTSPEPFATSPDFLRPITVARSTDGMVWVGDFDAQKIFGLDSEGNVTRVLDSLSGFAN